MFKYLKVEIGSRGEMDCNVVNTSVEVLEKKLEKVRKSYEEDLESVEEFLCIEGTEDGKLLTLGLGEEDSEMYIREDFEKFDELLDLWNENLDSERFRDLVWEIELEIFE